jgi:CubicO group peptidase (beta-lactamase class C family)
MMNTMGKDNGTLRLDLLKQFVRRPLFRPKGRQGFILFFASTILILLTLVGCGPSTEDLEAVDYTPLPGDDWKLSTPTEHGLDPMLVAELYLDAGDLETLYSLLVIKNGHLIAEGYFNEGSVEQKALLQSATKSYYSALVGIALDQGCLSSVDQKMIDFLPEFAGDITDPRKEQITIRQMLQMRAGFPGEESDPALWEAFLKGGTATTAGRLLRLIVEFPLTSDPGTEFQYSNVSSHLLGVIVARACDMDLKSYGQKYLFSLIDTEVGDVWGQDRDGYYYPNFFFTARDAAKFGLLYLNDGEYEGIQVISSDWVHDSLQTYSQDAYNNVGRFRDIGYGYQWWSASVGDHHVNFAWGHGGQLIVLLDKLDMVIVVTADPFHQQHDDQSWKHEKASFNLVGKFINSLPSE